MEDSSAPPETPTNASEIPRYAGYAEPVRVAGATTVMPPLRIPRLNRFLFSLTLLTTTMAGAAAAGADISLLHPLDTLVSLTAGLSFSIPLMAILLAHEMGHFLTSRRYGVDTSLPYFVPIIFPSIIVPLAVQIGTFGAFIRMRSLPRSRRAMFDIGAAGPWAGFLVALAAIIVGLHWSPVSPLDNSSGGIELGNSIVFWSVARVILGVDPDSVNVNLHPMAYAGWIGLFVTTLNLLPVGQLDGGHVIYSLFGPRWHRVISRYVWLGCLLMVIAPKLLNLAYWPGWILWFVLILVLGLGHPATQDVDTPLVGQRRLAAWATVLLFIVTFTPVPFSFVEPKAPLPPSEGPTYSVIYHTPPPTHF
ncbi:MAG TPA: site-2 protease family protein [Candidatus Binataceae bacterium]|nr:site-2 protease family protein [Candidatus Binataceae bacterium]